MRSTVRSLIRPCLLGSAVVALAACTWVPLTQGGEGVTVAVGNEIASCVKIGETHARTSDRAWIFARSDEKVDREVSDLARNEAAAMGGTHIVAKGPIADGRRTFHVFRCP